MRPDAVGKGWDAPMRWGDPVAVIGCGDPAQHPRLGKGFCRGALMAYVHGSVPISPSKMVPVGASMAVQVSVNSPGFIS